MFPKQVAIKIVGLAPPSWFFFLCSEPKPTETTECSLQEFLLPQGWADGILYIHLS